MRNAPALSVGMSLLLVASAQATLYETFDSFEDQNAFQAVWPSWAPDGSSMILGSLPDGSKAVHGVAESNYQTRNYRNLDSFTDYCPTANHPITFELWLYDSDPTAPPLPGAPRNFCELRAYAGDGIPASYTVQTQATIALGLYGIPVSADHYHARVKYGGVDSWYYLTTPRSPGWHQLTASIGLNEVVIYVDGALDTTVPLTNPSQCYAFDGVTLGSGLTSSGYDAWFDNILVTPEPATMTLLGAAALALIGNRKRGARAK